MSLAPGTRIGPYEIVAPIGVGGMGEVYRAIDTKLKRDVAVKVLTPSLASDPERLARFEREAEVLASLNHPNIAQIHGLEKAHPSASLEPGLAIVMELVEGPTLAERIAQGALPIQDALPIARQIADALEAAHAQEIVHRDLKPSNIKVRADGTVKVLDFGLAKPTATPRNAPLPASSEAASTLPSPVVTLPGVVFGTPAYMSPEQASGKPIDKRTDIWAFGCVLFEMLTGRQAFRGQDVAETIVKVMGDQPDWAALPAGTPHAIRRVIERCLEKAPHGRLHDIADARMELEEAAEAPPPPARQARGGPRRLVLPAAIGVLAGALVVLVLSPLSSRRVPEPVMRLSVPVPPEQRLSLFSFVGTAYSGGLSSPLAISPDGRYIVYQGSTQLFLRALDRDEATPISGTESALGPFFSPDGQWIGFVRDRQLMKVAISGGRVVAICSVGIFAGADWTTDDSIVFAGVPAGIFRVDSAGGTPELIATPEPGEWLLDPVQLPEGGPLLYVAVGATLRPAAMGLGRMMAHDVSTGEKRVLVQEGEFARYMPTGHLIYGLPRSGVFAAPFDPVKGELTGAPVALGDWGLPGPFGWRVAAFDASRTGHLAYLSTTADASARLEVWVDGDGRETPLPMAPGRYAFPALSPDGSQVAVTVGEGGSPRTDIWLHDLSTGGATRLTFDGTSSSPVWTADGRGLAFVSVASNLFLRAADGTAEPRRLSTSENPQFPYAWFDRGTKLLFSELTPDTALDVAVLDTADGGAVRALVASPANETRPALSPDERWLAYTSDESGRPEVYIRPFPGVETGRWQVSTGGGHSPLWTKGGSELVFRGSGRMMAVEVSRGAPLRLGTPRPLFEDVYVDEPGGRSYDVASDGHRFLMLKQQTRVAAFDEIHVVVNWFEELEAQAPSR